MFTKLMKPCLSRLSKTYQKEKTRIEKAVIVLDRGGLGCSDSSVVATNRIAAIIVDTHIFVGGRPIQWILLIS
jgi:hypothetical protein